MGVLSTDGSGCRCTALVMQPQTGEDAYAEVLRERQFDRGVACPCSISSHVRGIRTIVHGDDFKSGGPRHQLEWLEGVMDTHFESKHTVMGASSELAKSLVMLNRKILWQDTTSLYKSTVARLNYWAADRPDIQYAVRVCAQPKNQ